MQINDSIITLKGIGEKSAKLLEKLQIYTIDDLLHHLPRDYEVFEDAVCSSNVQEGMKNAMIGKILTSPQILKFKHLTLLQFYAGEEENRIRITIFNMPYLAKTLKPGTTYVFAGTVYRKGNSLCMDQPALYKPESYVQKLNQLQPIYAKTKGISNEALTKYIKACIKEIKETEELLPSDIVEKMKFVSHLEALKIIHMPENKAQLLLAKQRLAYEEFFYFLLSMNLLKDEVSGQKNIHLMVHVEDAKLLMNQLPYRLTESQQNVFGEIEKQMCEGSTTVNRLIQGDVGSGKTIVAFLCLLVCVANGYQGAFMAPTEVLAKQHYENVLEMIEEYKLPFKPALLTGSVTAAQKRKIKEAIEEGEFNLVIGTHALIQEDVRFRNLALVITDEQHRFGVAQRDKIAGKGESVHTIVMSATPIPRSLAIVLYGNLDVSTIKELPSNRLPIKNCVVGTGYRDTAHKFILEQVQKGRQAYVICPMVESGIMEELENVKDYSKMLKEKYGDAVRVAYLHGKMRPKEKNEIMESFAKGEIDVLVSTTVIEVGINVPNATVMMVENADRFGLAALHQIRGRVGRGKEQSYCIFVDTKGSKKSKERLEILNHSNDGFHIANEDLKLRGPGDLLGVMQSGDFVFRFADIYDDSAMLMQASKDVKKLLEVDRNLILPEHANLKIRLQQMAEEDYRSVL